MTTRNPLRRTFASGCALLASLCFAASSAWSQTASATPATTDSKSAAISEEKEIIKLSPFLVTIEESESGYLAKSTLAGNRTKTDLKDVGASIDVLTDGFLNDVGAFDMNDALEYVANMGNYDGSSGDLTNSSQWFAAPYNARGFRSDSSLIDFFPAEIIPIDRYNTESMTFLRGSNAILFGIGSPGGSINASFKRPKLNRDAYSFSHMTDTNESQRGEFDINKVLIKNKLGVRITGLAQERHSFKEPSLDRRRGLYGAVTYRPFEKTSITVTMDDGERNRYLALNNVALNSYTPWILAGRPRVNWQTGAGQNSAGLGNYSTGLATGLDKVSSNPVLIYVEGSNVVQNWRHMAESRRAGSSPNRIAFTPENNILHSPDGQQWRLDLSTNVFGKMNYHTTSHHSQSIFVQQNIIEGLDIELAANKFDVEYSADNAAWANRPEIQADPNELLPDGTPNPNVGKPYIEADRHRNETERRKFLNERATVSYELDLEDTKLFGNFGLGRYQLLGLWEEQEKDVWVVTGEQVNTTPLSGFNTRLDNSQNQIRRRYYFEPNETVYQSDGTLVGRNVGAGITPGWVIPFNVRRSNQVTESLVGALQARWWEAGDGEGQGHGYHRIVGMYGERHETFTTTAKRFTKGSNGMFPGDFRDKEAATAPGVWADSVKTKPKTKTYSVVVNLHSAVALFYNFSDIFRTADPNFQDIRRQALRPTFGDTEDYGVKLSLLRDRISVHATKYETRQVDQIRGVHSNIVNFSNEIWEALGRFDEVLTTPRTYQDDTTKGYELTVSGQIAENWNVRVTAGKQNTAISALFDDVQTWVDENWALWQANAAVPIPNNNRPNVGVAAAEVQRIVSDTRAVIGLKQTSQRQYNVRLNSTYTFNDGFLKGVSTGLGVRWDSENTLGFVRNPDGRLDVNRPFKGPELFNVDLNLGYSRKIFNGKVRWDIYLNVYNLLDDGGLRQRYAVDSGVDDLPVVTERYMIAPRTFQLRNTISF